jgi:hypothetical protein
MADMNGFPPLPPSMGERSAWLPLTPRVGKGIIVESGWPKFPPRDCESSVTDEDELPALSLKVMETVANTPMKDSGKSLHDTIICISAYNISDQSEIP